MSLIGIESKDDTLINALLAKDEKKALQALKIPDLPLHQKTNGLEAIHLAAQMGSKRVFRELVKKGVSPFTTDNFGYSPFHYAKSAHAKKIIALYDDFIALPSRLHLSRMEKEANDALLSAGLSVYILPLFAVDEEIEDSNKIKVFLKQLLGDGKIAKFLQKDIGVKKEEVGKPKEFLVEPTILAEAVAGLSEEISAVELLSILTQLYSGLALAQKVACLYLIKEMMCEENNQKWITSEECKVAFHEFLRQMGNENVALNTLKTKLRTLYLSKCRPSHLQDASALAFDLTKMYREKTLDVSLEEFSGENLVKRANENPGLLRLIALNNQVSHRVCLDVLEAPTLQKAAGIVAFYLNVIAYCLNEKQDGQKREYNFAAAFMIISGLQFNVISRLKGIEDLLSTHYKKKMKRYVDLFDPTGVLRNLQEFMIEHPQCIAPINIYTGRKTNLMDKPLAHRLLTMGKLNRQFQMQREYLASLETLNGPYQTDMLEVISRETFDEEQAYFYSFSIAPPKVILLDEKPDATEVLRQLKDCKDIKAPLAVKMHNQQFTQNDALAKMRECFADAIYVDEIVTLCLQVISTFEHTNKTRQDVLSIDALIDDIADLGLIEAKKPKKKSSFTTDNITSSSAPMISTRQERSYTALVGFAPDVESKEARRGALRKERMNAFEQIKGSTQHSRFAYNPLAGEPRLSQSDVTSASLAAPSPSFTPLARAHKRTSSSAKSEPSSSSSKMILREKDEDEEKVRVKKK